MQKVDRERKQYFISPQFDEAYTMGPFIHTVTFAALLLGCSMTAFSQWSTDPNLNNAISTAPNNQAYPTIVSDGAGGTIMTWHDYRSDAEADIYAQRVDANGSIHSGWPVDGVVISTAGNGQIYPTIVSDGAGGAIITWYDTRNGAPDIYAQRISGSGTVQWTANGVAISTEANQQYGPTIVSDGAGGAIITWYDFRSGSFSHIYAQRINAAGQVMWQENGFPISAVGNGQAEPTIVSDDAGGAIITWYDYRSGSLSDIYAQRIDASGAVQWTANGVAISIAANNQLYPTIVSDGTSGAIITWHDYRSGTNLDIYAQRINGSGTVQWVADGVAISTAANDQVYPTIMNNDAGGAIITWYDTRNGAPDIYAQRISGSGTVQWTANGVAISTAANSQAFPTIASDGAGGAIITWIDFRNGTNDDIYAQRITGSGGVQWAADGIGICTAANDQRGPTIVSDGVGGAIITWMDFRSGTYNDIYAQKVDRHGYLGIANPSVTAVKDVVGDQGGKVTVAWDRSYLDASPHQVVTYYSIWRGIEVSAMPAQAAFITPEELTANYAGKTFRIIVTPQGSTNWELVGTMMSHYFPGYSFTAPTLSDSTASGTPYFKFLVSAHTSNQFVFWDSNVDSGYSVDNLAPFAPLNVVGNAVGSTVILHWNRNQEADLAGYEVYRGRTPNFDPDTMTAYATTSDTMYTDVNGLQGNSYYALRAFDIHSNQSPKSNEVAIMLVGVDEKGTIPTKFVLHQNYPNPFNPTTTISFSLPAQSFVSLKVFNTLGEEVSVLLSEVLPAGTYSQRWNPEGLSTGVYFYRLQGNNFVDTKKLLLLR